ncbi:hypothetical protein NDU88_002080 [Pleurodeles waltl]|uniref:Uncharacterized protein n=1 Tax=Pleurodeles waltl TaxID=8319 RepID=A0AAV7WNF7_PLEWA|nr:hypothetical protein NDU88_002080 [Pleurodeles waltl]
MGLTPSRGGSLPAPRTHLSSRFRGRDQPGAADKMAAAAFCSGPLRGNTSARPPERNWSRQQVESGCRSGSRRRDDQYLQAQFCTNVLIFVCGLKGHWGIYRPSGYPRV